MYTRDSIIRSVLWCAWMIRHISCWGEVRELLPMRLGSDKKVDSEYKRNGTCSIFGFVEPLGGWHIVCVREHRTATDRVEKIKYLVDCYPEANKIVLVMDNLNTHRFFSLYKQYNPEEAQRIRNKLKIHYTPKHGSLLDIAEIELTLTNRQCLNRRIDNLDTLRKELSAYGSWRNSMRGKKYTKSSHFFLELFATFGTFIELAASFGYYQQDAS